MGIRTSRRTALLTAAVGLALGIATAVPADAGPAPAPRAAAPTAATTDAAVGQLAAAAGISRTEAAARLAAQARNVALADRLTARLGDRTGGAYFERSGALVVTVTDAAAAATVTAAGATARVVEHGAAELAAAKAALDKAGGVRNSTWGVDTAANQVVLTLPATARGTAVEKAAARFGSAVAVRRSAAALTEQNDIAGGDPLYNSGGGRCSAGFNVTNGATRFVLTAGHCTALGGTWNNYANLYIGPSAGSYFPGQDHGVVRVDSGLPQINGVYLYNNTFQTITAAGSGYAGLYACKSGSTTGVTCGYVQATNVTVNYAQGAVYGTDQTTICTQPGDSGGSYFTGATALGLVSGGTVGGCTSTSRSFFFPVLPALSYWGVSLI